VFHNLAVYVIQTYTNLIYVTLFCTDLLKLKKLQLALSLSNNLTKKEKKNRQYHINDLCRWYIGPLIRFTYTKTTFNTKCILRL